MNHGKEKEGSIALGGETSASEQKGASFCFFVTSKLVSPQCLLFTLFCFREKHGGKNLTINLNTFCLHAVADVRRIARTARARCTREAKFEVVQRHYIQIYPANFLLYVTQNLSPYTFERRSIS